MKQLYVCVMSINNDFYLQPEAIPGSVMGQPVETSVEDKNHPAKGMPAPHFFGPSMNVPCWNPPSWLLALKEENEQSPVTQIYAKAIANPIPPESGHSNENDLQEISGYLLATPLLHSQLESFESFSEIDDSDNDLQEISSYLLATPLSHSQLESFPEIADFSLDSD